MSCFLLKELQSVFFVKINSFSNVFDLNRKILPCFKRKQETFREKKIHGFVDSEFVEACHEHVISFGRTLIA